MLHSTAFHIANAKLFLPLENMCDTCLDKLCVLNFLNPLRILSNYLNINFLLFFVIHINKIDKRYDSL